MSKIKPVTDVEWELINKENKRIAKAFLNQRQLSPKTLEQYESAVRIFFRWVYEYLDDVPLHKLKPRHGLEYQNYLIEEGLANGSVRFKRSVVSSMCGYVENFYDDLDEYKTFRNIYNKKVPNVSNVKAKEKVPLTIEEYELLCEKLEEQERWQMLAFLKFTYASGCRKSEVHQILKEVAEAEKVTDKEGNQKNYYLTGRVRTKGKGIKGNVRRLQFNNEAMTAIKKWLEVRGEDDCPYLFVRKDSSGNVFQLSTATFNYWCSVVFSEIIGRHMFVHLIRSTRATHLVVEEGKDIKSAQAILGHADSSTTEIYVVRDDSEDLDSAFD
ncbi:MULTISPECIES: tyrosine-type recombinase/integrase [unclassified Lysinibacillus]|uniref:tyrosine-type recombinase/integrase n=1 Tax=unclassified Lysinibacillus TaxID=2636778 RepID=UPI002013862D|nr:MULTISPECIES: tyrosine-type recombinase/integrase [unclassified Lysinibacillus]MCL1696257.1 tyrosine-type recombinase/integrase [Lysinibacillus sp. BPa_S21]MCL1700847.1 tyrosine-type recombinase/integrase [Lysinibacillus sp. Bpr_S20]